MEIPRTQKPLVRKLLRWLGFKFPSEHGLTAIWASAILLGIGISLTGEIRLIGLVLALSFAGVALFGSDSIIKTIKSKFTVISWVPFILIVILTGLIFVWRPIWQTFTLFGILTVLTGAWLITAYQSRKLTPGELSLGAMDLAMLVPLIYFSSTTFSTTGNFLKALTIGWFFAGVSVLLILHVESLRGKVSATFPLLIWAIFLISFIPLFIFQFIHPFSLVALIEPTLHGINQTRKRELLKTSKRSIKTVGIHLVIRLLFFVTLILITFPLAFS